MAHRLNRRLGALGTELGVHEVGAFAYTPLLKSRLGLLRRVQRLGYEPDFIELLIDRLWHLLQDGYFDRACMLAQEATNLTRELLRDHLPPVKAYSFRRRITLEEKRHTLKRIASTFNSETPVYPAETTGTPSLDHILSKDPQHLFVDLPSMRYGMIPHIFSGNLSGPSFSSLRHARTAQRDLAACLEIEATTLEKVARYGPACNALGQALRLRKRIVDHDETRFPHLLFLSSQHERAKSTASQKQDIYFYLSDLDKYGYLLRLGGQIVEACRVFQEMIAILRIPTIAPSEPVKLGWALVNFASCLLGRESLDEALESYEEAISILRREKEGLRLAIALNGHASTLRRLHRFNLSCQSHQKAIKVLLLGCGDDCEEEDTQGDCFHRRYLPFFARDYASSLSDNGELEKARDIYRKAIKKFEGRMVGKLPDASMRAVEETAGLLKHASARL